MAAPFVIEELPQAGGVIPGGPARFEWTAAGHSVPIAPWTTGTQLRLKRTDYPGGDNVSFQVLGPSCKPFTLEGRWDDRYNHAGFAMETLKAFDNMVRRGNDIRISFQKFTFVGKIEEAEYPYKRDWQVGYSFTFNPRRAGLHAPLRRPQSAKRPLNAKNLVDALKQARDATRAAHAAAPGEALAGSLLADVNANLDAIDLATNEIDAVIRERIGVVEDAARTFLRLSQQFAVIRGRAAGALNGLVTARSDLSLAYQTALSVVSFDAWVRGVAFNLRLLVVGSSDSAAECAARAQPGARALYRPYSGESLYRISRHFYGTPHNWRAIANRNGLTYTDMTGEELLVIPEGGA